MRQEERRLFLLHYLLREQKRPIAVPADTNEQKRLLRALFNVRMPQPASAEFLRVQDEYLQEEIRRKGITDCSALSPVAPNTVLWRGDIITLACDGIVNAANAQMLGCFCPNHDCIDNAIHTFAGVQLRQACADLMQAQGGEEPTGKAKITPAYNLPSKFILHTVGPIVQGELTARHEEQLADCYRSCLTLAEANDLRSLAFCCISTGAFRFPYERAAEIAVQTVAAYRQQTQSRMSVIFDIFTENDYAVYAKLLQANRAV